MPAPAIREELPATELRRLARFEPDRRAGMRLLAIANAGRKRHGWPGWSGRRSGMPCCATMRKEWTGCTTVPARAARKRLRLNSTYKPARKLASDTAYRGYHLS
jgi:hypothetical protein